MQGIAQSVFDFALILGRLHVDEVNHYQAAQVAQAQLARHFVGSFAVGAQCRFFNVTAFGGAAGVDVNRDQGLGVINHDGTAGWQGDLPRIS